MGNTFGFRKKESKMEEKTGFVPIQAISKIGLRLEKSKLLKNALKGVRPLLKKLGAYLELSEDETIFFVLVFVIHLQEGSMDIRDLTKFLDVNAISLVGYRNTLEALLTKKMVVNSERGRNNSRQFFLGTGDLMVRSEIMEAIFNQDSLAEVNGAKDLDVYQFVRKVSDYIGDREIERISSYDLFNLVGELEEENMHLAPTLALKNMELDVEDRTLLYGMAHDFVSLKKSGLNSTMRNIYHEVRQRVKRTNEILNKSSKLFFNEMVLTGDGSYVNDVAIELTDKGAALLFGADAELFKAKKNGGNRVEPEKIAAKELFFDSGLKRQLEGLRSNLMQENFVELQARLERQQLPKGLTAIFYGAPGTGKSESVYQLAKETGRSIMAVDLSQTKSMWFGESEKLVKEIFTEYCKACAKSTVVPILLFNEADGVLGRRISGTSSAVSQTENTIQNILLEELERNVGIVIATTNLVENLDAAFERRFLFKVQFGKPSVSVKKSIWKSKLDWLEDDQAERLAVEFAFSGGEIDNIVRKLVSLEVLSNERPGIDQILEFCELERLHANGSGRKIGYK